MMSFTTDCPTGTALIEKYAAQIQNKIILITGASPNGLGAVFATAVVKANPSLLILAGRNKAKLDQVRREITSSVHVEPRVAVRSLIMDFASLASVRAAAEEVNGWANVPRIDILINNAGIMATPYEKSADGIEIQFAVNHLGPFLFTNLIIQKILKATAPRVVNVTSDGHRLGHVRWDDLNFDKEGNTYNKWKAYGQSKTANMLMTLSMAERFGSRGLLVFSIHPGAILTNLATHLDLSDGPATDLAGLRDEDRSLGNKFGWDPILFYTPDQGIATHVFAAFAPELKDQNGSYLLNARLSDPFVDTVKPWATSGVEAERLWRLSEDLVGQKFV